jgi:hypothetical protein
MFKRLVTLVRGLMGCQSMAPSSLTAEQLSPSVKRSRAKSTQASPQVAQEQTRRPRRQSPAPTQRKQKTEAAPSTTAARKPGKKKPTARQVAMVSQSKPTGSKSVTPARKTRQHAK